MNPGGMIAWAPTSTPSLVRALSVWVSPSQSCPVDRDVLISLLADRVQALINATDDPEDAVAQLAHQLCLGNVLPFDTPVSVEEAGMRLIFQNPAIEEQLSSFGVPKTIPGPIIEMAQAREYLDGDLEDSFARLMDWADAISRPAWCHRWDSDNHDSEAAALSASPDEAASEPNINPERPPRVIFTEPEVARARQRIRNKLGHRSPQPARPIAVESSLSVTGTDLLAAAQVLLRVIPARTVKSSELAFRFDGTHLTLLMTGAEETLSASGYWPRLVIVPGRYLKILAKHPLHDAVLKLQCTDSRLVIRGERTALRVPARWEDISPLRIELPLDACERDVLRLQKHHPTASLTSAGLVPRIESAEAHLQTCIDQVMKLLKEYRLPRADLESAIRELIMK